MKKLIPLLLLVPVLAFADDAVPSLLPPDAIISILTALQAIPYVGPVIVVALKWVALIAAIATPLSLCVQAVLAVPEIAARYQGAHALADKIKFYSDKVVYWLSYVSIRNAQKPKV